MWERFKAIRTCPRSEPGRSFHLGRIIERWRRNYRNRVSPPDPHPMSSSDHPASIGTPPPGSFLADKVQKILPRIEEKKPGGSSVLFRAEVCSRFSCSAACPT